MCRICTHVRLVNVNCILYFCCSRSAGRCSLLGGAEFVPQMPFSIIFLTCRLEQWSSRFLFLAMNPFLWHLPLPLARAYIRGFIPTETCSCTPSSCTGQKLINAVNKISNRCVRVDAPVGCTSLFPLWSAHFYTLTHSLSCRPRISTIFQKQNKLKISNTAIVFFQ